MSRPRCAADVVPQGPSNPGPMAARAAFTARATSAALPRTIVPKASPVLGSTQGIVSVVVPGCQPLSM